MFPEGMTPQTGPKGDLSAASTDNRVRTTRQIESSLRSLIRNTNAALSAAPLAKAAAEAEASYGDLPMLLGGEDMPMLDPEELARLAALPMDDTYEIDPSLERIGKTKLSIGTNGSKESAKEALVNLQLLASTNPDEALDPSLVNWQIIGRKRGVSAVDTGMGVVGKGRRLKWSV
jgi:hypothetical protein